MTAMEDTVDFQCCYLDTTYRQKVTVRNAGAAAVKVSAQLPPSAEDVLSVTPSFGFVQAGGSFAFAVTLCASAKAMARCERFVTNTASQTIEVPLRVVIPSQSAPVAVTLRAQLTTSDLRFDPAHADFGRCILGELTAVPVTVRNPSALPATVGMLDLPRGVTVKPSNGFATVEPGGSTSMQICFTPELPGRHSFKLACSTLALRTFHVPCVAVVGVLPLSFSHNRIELAATALGDASTASTALVNRGSEAEVFEFGTPTLAGLEVTPRCGSVPPGGRMRVQIDFRPPQPTHERSGCAADALDGGAAPALVTAVADASVLAGGAGGPQPNAALAQPHVAEQRWPRCSTCSIPCFIQGADADARGLPGRLHLSVETCTTQPVAALVGLPFDWSKGCYVHNFGPLSVGASQCLTLDVRNDTDLLLPLTVDPLDPGGAFESVSAARPVAARATQRVKIRFRPTCGGDFWEVVTLRVPGQALAVQLSGAGVIPRLALSPEGAPTGLDFGDIRVGDEAAQTITLHNPCPFELGLECCFRGACCNVGNVPAYLAKPGAAIVQPGESLTVTVAFQPDHQACTSLQKSCCNRVLCI